MKNHKQILFFFVLCFLAYFATYLGRLNYAASLAEMIREEGFLKGEAGLIGTAFFFSYGAGQLISGFAGDRWNCKWLVFGGLIVSAGMNAVMGCLNTPQAMMMVWCINGVAQSMVWSPMLHIICELLEPKERMKFCMYINYSVPLGTVSSYALSALLIGTFGWRMAFFVPSVLVGGMAFFWLFGMGRLPYSGQGKTVAAGVLSVENDKKQSKIFISSGLLFLVLALGVQGALKDGITTWTPVYLEENHGMGSIAAILSTMVIPFCNMLAVSLATFVRKRMGENEIRSASVFYGVCALALGILYVWGGHSGFLALCMLAAATTTMMSVNALLISVLPSRFGKLGKASGISGILNSCVYAGCAVSTYGIGTLSESLGWNMTILFWVAGAVTAGGICIGVSRRWGRYVKNCLD